MTAALAAFGAVCQRIRDAAAMVDGAVRYGLAAPTLEVLTLAVQSAARVGADTARAAADAALAGAE